MYIQLPAKGKYCPDSKYTNTAKYAPSFLEVKPKYPSHESEVSHNAFHHSHHQQQQR